MRKLASATATFLDLYQCSGDRPDLKRLGEIGYRFANLPWENLTKYIKMHLTPAGPESPSCDDAPGAERLRLSAEVLADHASLGTGGTCFSLTNALRRITTDLGFRAYPVMADMRHGANLHCALLVELDDERYLLDPGYLVPEPVNLRSDRPTRLRLAGSVLEYRPADGSDEIELHTLNERGEDVLRYRLRPRRIAESEFGRHWLASFDANGMNGLHLNRVAGGSRLSAHNLNLRIDDGRTKANVKLRDDYSERVSERFGIDRDLVRTAYAEWERRRCRTR